MRCARLIFSPLVNALFFIGLTANLYAAHATEFDAIDEYLSELQRVAAFDGIVLIRSGDTVDHLQVFGLADHRQAVPITSDTRFLLGELSQLVTRAAIGRLIEREQLTLQSRLADFLPDFPDARRITILQLVQHTSGIAEIEEQSWFDSTKPMSLDSVIAGLASESLRQKPGVRRLPSNGGYVLLAKVIEIVSEQSYAENIKTEFADDKYSSLAHIRSVQSHEKLALRQRPGRRFGEREIANSYYFENLIGASSLSATAIDLTKFVNDAYAGRLLSENLSNTLFPTRNHESENISLNSPSPFAHVSLNLNTNQSITIMSSNVARPANLIENVLTLTAGSDIDSNPVDLAINQGPVADMELMVGHYRSRNAELQIQLDGSDGRLFIVDASNPTAFMQTTEGNYYFPYYDWLCRFSAYNTEFECQERSGIRSAPVLFERK